MFYNLPPRDNEIDFENLCCDLWKEKENESFQLIGRKGQGQNGVDIIGRIDNNWIGIQCKWKSLHSSLTEEEIEKEVEKAKSFIPPLYEYIFTTTSPRDEKVQKKARVITEYHKKRNLFTVKILSWDELKGEIQTHKKTFFKYYKDLFCESELNVENYNHRILEHVIDGEIHYLTIKKTPTANNQHLLTNLIDDNIPKDNNVLMRCFKSLPSLSSFHTTRALPGCNAFKHSLSPGRSSFLPESKSL